MATRHGRGTRRTPLARLPLLAGWAVIAIALVVLVGWAGGSDLLTRVDPALPAMKANTALALLAAGGSLLCLAPSASPRGRCPGRALGALVALFGAVTCLEHLFGDLGIGQLVVADPDGAHPGRPAGITAVALFALGLTLATLHRASAVVSGLLSATTSAIILFGVVGYLFSVDELRGSGGRSGVAVLTLVALALLAVGLAALAPDRGVLGVVRREDAGARMARVLLPAVTAGSLAVGGLAAFAERQGWVDDATGDASATIAMTVFLTTVVLAMARRLRRADADLRRLARIVEAAADAMVSTDADGRFASWNAGAERLLGFRATEVLGRSEDLLVPDEEREELASRMGAVRGGRSIVDWPARRRTKDGRVVDLELTVSPFMSDDGTYLGATAVLRDVTERAAAAQRFAALLEAAPDAMVIVDGDGRIALVNRRAEELTGYARAELVGGPVERLVPHDVRRAHEGHRRRYADVARARPMGTDMGILLEARDGTQIPVDVSLSPLETGEGRFVIAAIRDVTQRLRAERDLARSEERFRRSFEDSGVGMALVAAVGGEVGELLEVNEALVEMTGYTALELRAVGPLAILHPADAPVVEEELERLVRGSVDVLRREPRIVGADGEVRWTALTASLVRDIDDAPVHAVLQLQDVTDRKRFEGELQHLADHDPLTGLFNRRRLEEELTREVALARRYGTSGAVLVMDLDHFKLVNDSFGHAAGDELIKLVSETLRSRLRETDVLGRLGGDEFAAVVSRARPEEARQIGEALLAAVREAARTPAVAQTGRVTASLGVALFDHRSPGGAEELFAQADIAMYDAKEAGRDRLAVYDARATRHRGMRARLAWTERIEDALEHDRFVLHAQPIQALDATSEERFELLLRMEGASGDLIAPGPFLSVAERSDLAQRIDRWVVLHAVAMLEHEQRSGRDIVLEVNLSARSMADPDVRDFLVETVSGAEVDPSRLVFEVTESVAITDIARATAFADTLRDIGCRFAIDDFGTGFASFYYLKHLRFDLLKIDGEFIEDLTRNRTNQLIVRSIVDIARGLGKRTIAECVGDEATVELLRAYGVDFAQGFHIGRPGPLPPAPGDRDAPAASVQEA